MEEKITASALYDYVHCPHRVFLDKFEDYTKRDEISPFVRLLWERGYLYEKEVISKLEVPFTDLSAMQGEEKEDATTKAINNSDSLIYSGRITFNNKVGEPDILRKNESGYIAGDIKSGAGLESSSDLEEGKPKKHYTVQLALYTDILIGKNFGSTSNAFVWDINGEEIIYDFDKPLSSTSPTSLWQFYKDCENDVSNIYRKKIITNPAYSSMCKLCQWRTFCTGELIRSDDLTLIPELGRQKRDTLNLKMMTVKELADANINDYTDGKKTIFRGIGLKTLKKFQYRAALQKDPNPKPLLTGNIVFPTTDIEIFFDVETDPMRDICYLHGFYVRHKNKSDGEYTFFYANDISPEEEKNAFANAFKFVNENQPSIIYYYSKYERTIWRKLQQKYPSVCSPDQIEDIFSNSKSVDLYFDVVKKFTEWPTYNYSIKTLAQYLGFKWRDEDPSGASSIEWYHQWIDKKDPLIKKRIIEYNEDDCVATAVLLDGLRELI